MTTNPVEQYTKISDTLSSSFVKLYKVGGMALVSLFVGVLMMIVGFLKESGPLTAWIFAIGALVTVVNFMLFAYIQYKGPLKAVRAIQDNKQTIDSLQLLSLRLTRLAYNIQAYSFKNLDTIQSAVTAFVPIIKPFLGNSGTGISDKINSLSSMIVVLTKESEGIIRDVEKALMESDFKILLKYSQDLDAINDRIQKILAGDRPGSPTT